MQQLLDFFFSPKVKSIFFYLQNKITLNYKSENKSTPKGKKEGRQQPATTSNNIK